jgi:hypothetical protein
MAAPRLIQCESHGKRPIYLACVHVMNGTAPIAKVTQADGQGHGEILCAACKAKPDVNLVRPICDMCADVRLLSRLQPSN